MFSMLLSIYLRFETRSTLSPDVTADVTARGGEVAVGVGPVALESSPGCTSVKVGIIFCARSVAMGVHRIRVFMMYLSAV